MEVRIVDRFKNFRVKLPSSQPSPSGESVFLQRELMEQIKIDL